MVINGYSSLDGGYYHFFRKRSGHSDLDWASAISSAFLDSAPLLQTPICQFLFLASLPSAAHNGPVSFSLWHDKLSRQLRLNFLIRSPHKHSGYRSISWTLSRHFKQSLSQFYLFLPHNPPLCLSRWPTPAGTPVWGASSCLLTSSSVSSAPVSSDSLSGPIWTKTSERTSPTLSERFMDPPITNTLTKSPRWVL